MVDTAQSLAQVAAAAQAGQISPSAAENLRKWLTEPYLADFVPQVQEEIAAGHWPQLQEAFWKTIPFGTGGRRGWLYRVGCNAINDRTIGESAQGLADYVKEQTPGKPLACAIAYDTRHRSRDFAELCSEIMVAAGFKVYFLDGYRSTPELSFLVRYKHCDCGIMITASHNPPSDNAVKVYGASGGQLVSPHDTASIARMESVTWIQRTPFAEALAAGQVEYCQVEVDRAFQQAVLKQSVPGPRNLKIIYSPLHGVGATAVCPVLAQAGFTDVEVYARHATPDPDFPNVPKHVANPENAAVFEEIIARAQQTGAELILATDPDCDRLGCAAPQRFAAGAPWATLTGNQIGALLSDFLLRHRRAAGTLTPEHYVVKTLVTTELIRRVADGYGIRTSGDHQVGFKFIGAEMDRLGPEKFILGAEESYGFLVGAHARDKDAAVAAMLLSELAAELKAAGQTLHEKLDELFRRYGCHTETQLNVQMPGEQGMDNMRALMSGLRSDTPRQIAGAAVEQVLDYVSLTQWAPGGAHQPFVGPEGDMVRLLLAGGNAVAIRPSGTEPKVKFYMFAFDPPAASADVDAARARQAARLKELESDLRALAAKYQQ